MMKKMLFCLNLILIGGAIEALPLGNPAEASLQCDGFYLEGYCGDDPCISWCDAISARFGYYGDFVFNRHMTVDESWSGKVIENTRMRTNAGYIAANIYDRFDVFGTFGGTAILIDTNASAFGGANGSRLKIESNTHFSWSVGARVTLFEWGCTSYGIEAQYFYTRPGLTKAFINSDSSDYPDHFSHMKYWEWQVGIGIAHRINNIVPYIGAKYSRGKLNFDNTTLNFTDGATITLHNIDTIWNGGFVAGVTLIDCEKMTLTVEYRCPDERAFYVNGQVRF